MLAIAVPEARAGARSARRVLRRPSTATLCFLGCFALYMAAGAFVAFNGGTDVLGGDGVSRVEIADRILFSRDPHLAAIGFVWSPLPILSLLPLVALKPIFPFLVTGALAGNIVSALFMAGAVVQMRGLLADLGVSPRRGWALTACFALHPMIILYAANAMSEAPFIFFLLLVGRRLHQWLQSRDVRPLVATGFFLALGYLTRYEAAAAAGAVVVVVVVATLRATRGGLGERVRQALVDVIVVVAPLVAAVVCWAVISWVITGSLFEQFTSTYGNQVQLQTRGLGGAASLTQIVAGVVKAARWMIGVEPFLPLVLIACLAVVVRRRSWSELGVVAMLGGVVAFMTYAFVTGKVDEELRYFIVAIPLVIVMVGIAVARSGTATRVPAADQARAITVTARPASRWRRAAAGPGPGRLVSVVAVAAMVATIPLGYLGISDPALDAHEAMAVQAVVNRGTLTRAQSAAMSRDRVDVAVSRYVDALNLGPGRVLLDDFLGYVIVMKSAHQDQYVITSDTDFQQILSDPSANGVEYVLVPSDRGMGTLDAVNRAYPGVYATGRGIGTLVTTFHDSSDNHTDWRLYRVSSSG